MLVAACYDGGSPIPDDQGIDELQRLLAAG
jgi:hypothetical protein